MLRSVGRRRRQQAVRDAVELNYAYRRQQLLIELRLLRLTQPARRVVKHVQRQLRQLRTYRRMMEEADGD